jgi:hypothetical protein
MTMHTVLLFSVFMFCWASTSESVLYAVIPISPVVPFRPRRFFSFPFNALENLCDGSAKRFTICRYADT